MKKFLSLVLIITFLFITGCNKEILDIEFKDTLSFKTLNKVSSLSSDYVSQQIDQNFVTGLNMFSLETSQKLFIEEENYVYSPASLYMALSMLLEGADDNSYSQLANLLKVDSLDNLRNGNQAMYQNNYYTNKGGIARMANSIWFKQNFPIRDHYVNDLANYYYANAYQCAMNNETKNNLVKWINHNTFDFLDLRTEALPDITDLVVLLVNTVYFDNKWQIKYQKEDISNNYFYGINGQTEVEFMRHEIGTKYLSNDKYQSVIDYFENGNTIQYVLPHQDSSVIDILSNSSLMKDIYAQKGLTSQEVKLYTPKFMIESKYNLNESLQELGVTDIFDEYKSNLSKICNESQLFVSFVEQIAKIELSEEGVKAAAVTSIGVQMTSVPEYVLIELNRPFIYIIRDANQVPLFVGVVNYI